MYVPFTWLLSLKETTFATSSISKLHAKLPSQEERSPFQVILEISIFRNLVKFSQIYFRIYIVNQTDDQPFNRGKLFNAGFRSDNFKSPYQKLQNVINLKMLRNLRARSTSSDNLFKRSGDGFPLGLSHIPRCWSAPTKRDKYISLLKGMLNIVRWNITVPHNYWTLINLIKVDSSWIVGFPP